ncbi:MAG TPA: DNA mismatch repair endonuclease MutL [Candidatus Absconditabacterales bacterium]|nr:DNA mismatch repair endonuclease MutL [Candidatus Absconditabacterales bacterium]HPK28227.1 DNA mismatch repair endonuclease MutL [Candidatus Absconditabacterales bacterium]
MAIAKLADYVINRLKAGEVVNRPSNVLKELVENSIDAGATSLEINIVDGGKNLISVQDNGEGIQLSDMDLLLERYATSKLKTDEDLLSLSSYGFRGEALASIAEVSKITVLSKTAYSEIGTKLTKRGTEKIVNHQPVPFENGTVITVEDLFYNVPARLKFLKSTQTEFYYCYNYFVDVALWHHDKDFIFKKNDKVVFDLKATDDLIDRINEIFKKDWKNNLKTLDYSDDDLTITGVVSDPTIRFGSSENIKIYVNSRPIQDKIIYKAIMDAYNRQISPGEFPFVVLKLDIKPELIDVNVHPSKLQVKFVDSQKIYQLVYNSVYKCLSDNKITSVVHDFIGSENSGNTQNYYNKTPGQNVFLGSRDFNKKSEDNIFGFQEQKIKGFPLSNNQTFDFYDDSKTYSNPDIGDYQIVGQLWNTYIVLQSNDALYYIDQHALAERIAFENMKKATSLKKELLLQPVKFSVTDIPDLQEKITQLNELGFDCSLLSENVMVVYAVPNIFITYPVDLEILFNYVLYLEDINFNHVLDGVFATKACKTSIKAGHKLSYEQMANLVKEGFDSIEGMFVCQHGRPFFVKIEKGSVDKMFDR